MTYDYDKLVNHMCEEFEKVGFTKKEEHDFLKHFASVIREAGYEEGAKNQALLDAELIKKAREEERQRIVKTMREYLELNTDDNFGTVDIETFGQRMIEFIASLEQKGNHGK